MPEQRILLTLFGLAGALRLTVSTDLADWRSAETVGHLHMTERLHPPRPHLRHAARTETAV